MKYVYAVTWSDAAGEDVLRIDESKEDALKAATDFRTRCRWKGFMTYYVRKVPLGKRIDINECELVVDCQKKGVER